MVKPDNQEQEKPLALAAAPVQIIDIDVQESFSGEFTTRPHLKCIKCCGCCAAIFLILFTITLILMFTIFRVRDPVLTTNSVKIEGVNVLSQMTNSSLRHNLTIIGDVSIKNPNIASFKFGNATTYVYYDDFVIGEAMIPEGQAGAQKTIRMNVTIDVMVDKLIQVPRFSSDLVAGILPISIYTRIIGKVKIGNVIRRSVAVRMNCSMNVNIGSQKIQDYNCRRHVSL